jgi:monoamine oxidase
MSSSARVRTVVVGGGLAGLVAAYRLRLAGASNALYEASSELGGRVATARGLFAEGQRIERGADLIGSEHTSLLALVRELGLHLDDLHAVAAAAARPAYHVGGQAYSAEQLRTDLATLFACPSESGLDGSSRHARAQDQLSVREWIANFVPGGESSQLGRLLQIACTVEYGAEVDDLSALSLVYMLGTDPSQAAARVLGESDDRYRVRGGNDLVVDRLGAGLGDSVTVGHELVAASSLPDGGVRLTFRADLRYTDVHAASVVLAVPFSRLREVDLAGLELAGRTRTAIAELGMGAHAKLHLQFRTRRWLDLGCDGTTLADRYQCTWEETAAQPGTSGILVNFRGGKGASTLVRGLAEEHARAFLAEIEPVLPGLAEHWNGRAVIDDWTSETPARGSYAYYRIGQYTQFEAAESRSEGFVHFVGEHACAEFQGYMEGAVRSGERAARRVLEDA